MSSVIRQCIAYLLIALLPLQAAAAGRIALCAEMTHTVRAAGNTVAEHCAQMSSMQGASTSDTSHAGDNHKPQANNSGCWLGSICLAGLGVFALPAGYTITRKDRATPVPLPKSTHYHSVIAAVPQRPPAITL